MSKNDKAPFLVEKNESSNLLVSFGGIAHGLGGSPMFEFYNSLKTIHCDKLFIRDFRQGWYHLGVDNKIVDIDGLSEYLVNFITEGNYKKVCFLGNSMGGYAALLLGNLIGVDRVIAFVPQTFIGIKLKLLSRDFRWLKELSRVYFSRTKNVKYFDLNNVITKQNINAEINVYYSADNRLDKIHANRLAVDDRIKIEEISKGGHGVAKVVRDSGDLEKILNNLFSD